jgi:hypothetical protein
MHPVGFDPTIPASKRPQTHTLDRATTGIGPTHSATSIVAIRGESPNIKTERLIRCCLVRAVAWSSDGMVVSRGKPKYIREEYISVPFFPLQMPYEVT